MSIEELVKKFSGGFLGIDGRSARNILRSALTEQANEYERRIKDLQLEILADGEAQSVPEWQPIETAPANELILLGPTKRMGLCVGMNHSFNGWVTETPSDWVSIYTPTHWMPLPAAPAPKDGE